jgi:hypothetical protein
MWVSRHAEANLAACDDGPLPEAVVVAFDQAWQINRPLANGYFKGSVPTSILEWNSDSNFINVMLGNLESWI